MNKSTSIKSLSEALAKAQATVKNPHFDAMNPHFKSKFASLAAVREAVIPVFSLHGLSVSQWPVSQEGFAGCTTHLAHASGEWIEETFLIPVDKHNAHGYASAVTYAKRIAMQSVAAVVGDEDDDANAAVGDNVAGAKGATPTGGVWEALSIDQQNHLMDICYRVRTLLKKNDVAGAYAELTADDLDGRENLKVALWSRFDSKERRALGDHGDKVRKPRGATTEERAAA